MAKAKKKIVSRAVKSSGKTHPKATLITWIVLGALILGLVGGYIIAKVKYTHYISLISVMFSEKDSQLNEMKAKMSHMNGVMRVAGKMMVMKDGRVSVMTEDVTMSDGTKVMMNGEYQKPGQDPVMMKNGEAMDMNGNMMEDDSRLEF